MSLVSIRGQVRGCQALVSVYASVPKRRDHRLVCLNWCCHVWRNVKGGLHAVSWEGPAANPRSGMHSHTHVVHGWCRNSIKRRLRIALRQDSRAQVAARPEVPRAQAADAPSAAYACARASAHTRWLSTKCMRPCKKPHTVLELASVQTAARPVPSSSRRTKNTSNSHCEMSIT